MISPRNVNSKKTECAQQQRQNWLIRTSKLIFPPFIILFFKYLYIFFLFILRIIKGVFTFSPSNTISQQSKAFHIRTYEEPVQQVTITQDELGFSNNVLYQQNKKSISLYIPVYVTCKVKNIQQISIQNLTGNVNTATIVNVYYGDLPQEVIQRLCNQIMIQFNRGDPLKLVADDLTVTQKRDKKNKFLMFTVRKLFVAHIEEDTLWSPFEILNFIITLTFNSVTIAPMKPEKEKQWREQQQNQTVKSIYNPKKQYKISFNNMRNSELVPISFALDCTFGLYDLAEKKLEMYSSKLGTYGQIKRNYAKYLKKKSQKINQKKGDGEKKQDKLKMKKVTSSDINTEKNNDQVMYSTIRRLSMRSTDNVLKPPPKKVKYFQYVHFVVPLYKYPGNPLATIFIPIFLLDLLSVAIYYQEAELSGRVGSIATMILGFISLIPTIKETLPPTAKITIIETLVYIQSVSCLLCLYESFTVRNINPDDYNFIWYESKIFLVSSAIHISVFMIVVVLMMIHKFVWEPGYNLYEKITQFKPSENRTSWDNPFCDEVFIKFNKDIKKSSISDKEKDQQMVKIYGVKPQYKKEEKAQKLQTAHQTIQQKKPKEQQKLQSIKEKVEKAQEDPPTFKLLNVKKKASIKHTQSINIDTSGEEFILPLEDQYFKSKGAPESARQSSNRTVDDIFSMFPSSAQKNKKKE